MFKTVKPSSVNYSTLNHGLNAKKTQSDKAFDHHLKGLEYLKEKKYNEAIACFSRCSFLDTCEASIYLHKAEAYLGVLEFETAIRNYRQCLKLQRAQSKFVLYRLGHVLHTWGGILLDSRRYQEAIEILDESLHLGAPETSCTLKRAFALMGLGKYELALTLLYELTEIKKDSADLYIFRAEIHKHLGKVDLANLDMIKARELEPNHPNLRLIYEWIISVCVEFKIKADRELLNGCHQAALYYLNQAIVLDSTDWPLLVKRGNIFKILKDWENSIQDYLTVLSNTERDQTLDEKIKTSIAEIYFTIAESNFNAERYLDSINDFSTSIAYNPNNYQSWSFRSQCFFRIKRHKEAISDSLLCLELKPDHSESLKILSKSHYEIGSIKFSHGNLHDALSEFTKSISYYSADPQPFISRARVYELLQDIDKAREDIDMTLRLDPSSTEALALHSLLSA